MNKIEAVISDFGGVLTTPLVDAFLAIQTDTGASMEDLGQAMQHILAKSGHHPLHRLERGELSEADFLQQMEQALATEVGKAISLHEFRNSYFRALKPNHEVFQFMRELKERSLRLALLTNNVREWEPTWRSMLPIDEIFELVVDSGFVGMRKPEERIYRLTLERLGLPAEACLFVDDFEENCRAAAAVGMQAIRFVETEQTIDEIGERIVGGN